MSADEETPLSPDEVSELECMLELVGGVWTLPRLKGLLTAVASAPTAVPACEWPDIVFDDEAWGSTEESDFVFGLLIRLEHSIAAALGERRSDVWMDLDDDEDLIDWCEGYLEGVALDPIWMGVPEGASSLDPWRVIVGDHPATEDEYERARAELPDRVLEMFAHWLYRVWGPESDSRLEAPRPVTAVRIGRNQPCPCGSGKKFKRCCGGA